MKKTLRTQAHAFGLAFALVFGIVDSIAFGSDAVEANTWARSQIESTLRGCSKKTPASLFSALKALELEFSTRVDRVPLAQLKEMPQESEFIEMGEVLFPAMLPRRYPAKLLYMACDEEHQAFTTSKSPNEFKENLVELRDCLNRSYRVGMPKLAGVLLTCYQDLISR